MVQNGFDDLDNPELLQIFNGLLTNPVMNEKRKAQGKTRLRAL